MDLNTLTSRNHEVTGVLLSGHVRGYDEVMPEGL